MKLSNKNASPEAVRLYEFLLGIRGKYTLSGQHNYITAGNLWTERVYESTQKVPAVWSSDFSFCYDGNEPHKVQHCGPLNILSHGNDCDPTGISPEDTRGALITNIKNRHSEGHIITLMWHNCFPTCGDIGPYESLWAMNNRPDPDTWNELVTKGTELNSAWTRQLDIILPYLKELRDAKIPVLWRPYHEMNGDWFWWCNQKGENGFQKLWIMMHDCFTKEHGLDNLIWVWNANAPRDRKGDEAHDYEDFYPGGEYVDVLAADVYRNDYKQSHHDDLVTLAKGRPVALAEVGEIPTPEILDKQPEWTWFMTWGIFLDLVNTGREVRRLYHDPRILSREDISRKKDGSWEVIRTESGSGPENWSGLGW